MAGICNNASIQVTLFDSDNKYLIYPVKGLLELLETGNDGSIMSAVFRRNDEKLKYPPVEVKNPKFAYNI